MSSLTMRRARERYTATKWLPYTSTGRTGHRAGSIYLWAVGVGLILFITWFLALSRFFYR